MSTVKSLLSAGALVSVGMMVGRLLGLLREMLLAAQFGTGHSADTAIALLIIPDFITAALIGSAASATLLPAFTAREPEAALSLFWQAMLVGIVGFAIAGILIFLMAPSVEALPIALLSLPLTAATAVATAWLQHRGRMLVPAFATVIFNSVILLTLWLAPSGLYVLATGIVGAALTRLLAHMIAFKRDGGHLPHSPLKPWQLKQGLLKSYLATAGNGIFGLLPQYAPYAVLAAAGSIATFNYAYKLSSLPGMLGLTVVQLTLLPWLVRLRKDGDAESQAKAQTLALQVCWLFSLCVCLALGLIGHPLAELCFGHGKMTVEDIAAVGQLFTLGVWAMPGMLLSGLWQQIWYAHEQTGAPLVASMLQSAAILPLCMLGNWLAGAAGVLIAFAVTQALPIPLLARHGGKVAMPSRMYLQMSLLSLVVFAPLALLFTAVAPPPLVAIPLAVIIGLLMLAAGMLGNPTMKAWLLQTVKRA